MSKNQPALTGVAQTMLLPLWGRYSESVKPDGLIRDDKCVEMVRQSGLNLAAVGRTQHPLTRLAWVARAWNADAALRGLTAQGNTTVLCLGCGLDTAFYRSGAGAVRWYDMDLPAVIAWRRQLVGEHERCRMIPGSVLDKKSYASVHAAGRLVVLALGLLCYFTADEVRRILSLAADAADDTVLVCDYFSKTGVAVSNRMVVAGAGAPMVWHAELAQSIAAMRPDAQVLDDYALFKRIMPLLSPADAAMAAKSDAVPVESMAVVRLQRHQGTNV